MKYGWWILCCICCNVWGQKIDRKAVVSRHNVVLTAVDTLASLSVGNGSFAFTVDATGLQSFPQTYAKGIPLGTQSDWGWHSFANTEGYQHQETLQSFDFHGRSIPYAVQAKLNNRQQQAVEYFRANPHRLQMGHVGFVLLKANGDTARLTDLQDIHQTLDLWRGEIRSQFVLEGQTVRVNTLCHPTQDQIAIKVQSALLAQGRLQFFIHFSYPTGAFLDEGVNDKYPERHQSKATTPNAQTIHINRQLDATQYWVSVRANRAISLKDWQAHRFLLQPPPSADSIELSVAFSPERPATSDAFGQTSTQSRSAWEAFWKSGAAVDFSGTPDPRAFELERRVVLSQYLTRIQCVGNNPPQETGLTYNSWYGKPHLEMHWWHGTHFAQWGRLPLLQTSLNWYRQNAPRAKQIAQRQGYEGVRWPKMTDPQGGEAPSSVGSFLIWQQPHLIYFVELCYQQQPNSTTLRTWGDLVEQTATFMASFARAGNFALGKGIIPAQECFRPETTFNPTYELAYWRWGLEIAQQWRKRRGLPTHTEWQEVLAKLAPLPQRDGLYLATESTPDSYSNPAVMIDHPAVLGALGMLPPTEGLNLQTMQRTLDTIWQDWNWAHTWGWDFPMVAMTATRLHQPERAVEALLMDVRTNTYLKNGHNFQDARLRLYLPGNGGLLSAVAMMCTGAKPKSVRNQGFPSHWKVKWEGFTPML